MSGGRVDSEQPGWLAAAGLTVPRELDPTLKKALVRCYQLQAGCDAKSAQLKRIREIWDSIVGHYKRLEYYEVAEAAIQVKAEKAVEAADEYAAYQLIRLRDEAARRGLARFFEQYGASEKIALGWHLDGTVSALFGTHTHVQTADEGVLPKGTGYITDLGMTGPHASVIGREVEPVLKSMVVGVPARFEVARDDVRVCGALFTVDGETGRAKEVERVCCRTTPAS